MQPSYIDLAQVTKSNEFHGDKLQKGELLTVLGAAIVALNQLDAIKKTLFYGREFPNQRHNISENCRSIASGWTTHTITVVDGDPTKEIKTFSEQRAIDVIHAILGKATESGELLELLNETIRSKAFDPVNFGEEMFDGQWYDAIGCTAINMTFEQGQATNIAKLKKRFGDKFTAWYANNRDLVAERQTLEAGGALKEVADELTTRGTGIAAGANNVPTPTITPKELEYALNALSYDADCNTPDFAMAHNIVQRVMQQRESGAVAEKSSAIIGGITTIDQVNERFRTDPIG